MAINRERYEQEIFISPREMSAEIDALRTRLACGQRYISRSEVLRRLIRAGLDSLAAQSSSERFKMT